MKRKKPAKIEGREIIMFTFENYFEPNQAITIPLKQNKLLEKCPKVVKSPC